MKLKTIYFIFWFQKGSGVDYEPEDSGKHYSSVEALLAGVAAELAARPVVDKGGDRVEFKIVREVMGEHIDPSGDIPF